MKIGFAGFQRTGKTTAAHRLVSEIKLSTRTCNLVSGAARSSRRLLLRDLGLDTHLEIIGTQIAMEAQAGQFSDFVVCDRTVLDYVAYGRCRGLHIGPTGVIFRSISDFCQSYAQTYDVIFIVKGTLSNRDGDQSRKVEDVGEGCFDREIACLTEPLGPRVKLVATSSDELLDTALDWLHREGNSHGPKDNAS